MTAAPPKTVLITGCSANSVGSALALEFQRRGFRVLATARSQSRLTHLASTDIYTFQLDTTSTLSITSLIRAIRQLPNPRIDILFNNAGTVTLSPAIETPIDAFKRQFAVNVVGSFELTQALLPFLIESSGIVVNHTSQSPYGFSLGSGAYCASKAALAALTDTLRMELKPFGIRVVELVTTVASSNMTETVVRQARLSADSAYAPIRAEWDETMKGDAVMAVMPTAKVYAREVVAKLLDSWWGVPLWIWAGPYAWIVWVVWLAKCMRKGLFDGLFGKVFKLDVLERRLREHKDGKRVLGSAKVD